MCVHILLVLLLYRTLNNKIIIFQLPFSQEMCSCSPTRCKTPTPGMRSPLFELLVGIIQNTPKIFYTFAFE